MEIKTKLTEKDFINVNFTLLLRKPSTIVFLILAMLSIFFTVSNNSETGKYSFVTILPVIAILVIFPLMVYVMVRRNYRSNSRIQETIEYKFGSMFEVKGESFSSQLTWDKIYKVTKTKNWLLIWQSRQLANIIPLRDVWQGDITTLKEILDSHKVKNNL